MTSLPSQLLLLAVHLILLSFLLFFYTKILCSVTKIASPLNNPACVFLYIPYSCQSNTRFQFNKCTLIGCTLKSRNVIVVWRSFVQVPPPVPSLPHSLLVHLLRNAYESAHILAVITFYVAAAIFVVEEESSSSMSIECNTNREIRKVHSHHAMEIILYVVSNSSDDCLILKLTEVKKRLICNKHLPFASIPNSSKIRTNTLAVSMGTLSSNNLP